MGEDFFRHAYKSKCKVEVNKAIISDIEAGVRKMIELILQRVQSRCPEFRVADIITTGSFYEGTKIGPPDTFDFMIALARLSGTDKISLQPRFSVQYPYIKLQQGVDFTHNFKNNVRDGG